MGARPKDGVWAVMGTVDPPGAYGGVAMIQTRKSSVGVIPVPRMAGLATVIWGPETTSSAAGMAGFLLLV